MLKTSSNGTQAPTSSAIKFSLRPTAETLADLSRPIDPRHFKTRKQGSTTLTYCPSNTIARHLHHRAPGWCWEVQSVQEVGGAVVVTGRLTIPTADGDLLHYSAVASELLESASKAPAAEVAASSCLRRAAALAGLGLELWGVNGKRQAGHRNSCLARVRVDYTADLEVIAQRGNKTPLASFNGQISNSNDCRSPTDGAWKTTDAKHQVIPLRRRIEYIRDRF
jgi:hypothetical protein